MTRTFIALEMHATLQSHLAGVIQRMAQVLPHLHWVDPVGIHLTIAFLGELDADQLAQTMQATEVAARQIKPFSYRLTRVGTFGPSRQPRVIWMGIAEPSGTLLRLHSILNEDLAHRGFTLDSRPFSPHLTLARIKAPLTSDEQLRLQHILAGNQQGIVSTIVYPVYAVNVMKSELSRAGAHYTPLQVCALRAV